MELDHFQERLSGSQHLQNSAGGRNRHGCTLKTISRSTMLHQPHFPKQTRSRRKHPFLYQNTWSLPS